MLKILNLTNLSLAALFAIAILIQTISPLHGDVSYLMFASNGLFHGDQYGIDLFETNPPLILYLYYPVVKISQALHVSQTHTLRLFIFFAIASSICICKKLMDDYFKNKTIVYFILFSLVYALCILPGHQFGQREHITVILTLPYFFSTILLLENKALSKPLSFVIGLLAGIGFSIKPFFILPLALTEITIMFKKKNFFSWIRIPPIIIGCVMIAYLITIQIFSPTYLKLLYPFVHRFYFSGAYERWSDIFSSNIVITFILLSLIGIFLHSKFTYRNGILIFSVALIGFLLSALITKTTWFSHLLPAFIMGFIVTIILVSDIVLSSRERNSHIYTLTLASLMSLLIFSQPIIYSSINFYGYISEYHGQNYQKLVKFIANSTNPRTITCFSVGSTESCFPLVVDTNSTYTSRYPFFWWTRGITKLEQNNPKKFAEVKPQIEHLIKIAENDLEKNKTRWILINDDHTAYSMGEDFKFFDFLTRQYPPFKETIGKYHMVRKIGAYSIYERLQT